MIVTPRSDPHEMGRFHPAHSWNDQIVPGRVVHVIRTDAELITVCR